MTNAFRMSSTRADGVGTLSLSSAATRSSWSPSKLSRPSGHFPEPGLIEDACQSTAIPNPRSHGDSRKAASQWRVSFSSSRVSTTHDAPCTTERSASLNRKNIREQPRSHIHPTAGTRSSNGSGPNLCTSISDLHYHQLAPSLLRYLAREKVSSTTQPRATSNVLAGF